MFTDASERQEASSVPVTIIEHIAAAQMSKEAKVLRLNKLDWMLGFFFIKDIMGAVAAWDAAWELARLSGSVKVSVSK
jgi:hypothetical protein